jgi:sarcosine oxidase subunit beta
VQEKPVLSHLVQHVSKPLAVVQVADGNILISGGWHGNLDLERRCMPRLDSIIGNLRLAAQILPFVRELRLLRAWAGPVAATRDELPACGEVSALPGFFIATGTYSYTFAPLFGVALVAQMLGKQPPIDLTHIRPDRLMS